jgi:putative FmdB family regulatory protein
MPVYTYRCENCGVQFDRFLSFNDQPLTRCPECNKKSLRKVYTPVGIVFKGSGFYSTDHRSASGSFNRSSKSSESETKGSESETKDEPAKTSKESPKEKE